ncbi:DUF3800 domain-containing protein [Acidianus ambivalens]|uniref:DUF3800 domain-containing protein n=1 Tax=Acidianus ambivalens TaxID=2283 RepID=A0A650CTG6_ACIAM|nr:DUF3800 domain-containing protein [Acidianus ambivalens]QGR21119.1 DUF3800 domain-containing protein [Acidianus ambivalens]
METHLTKIFKKSHVHIIFVLIVFIDENGKGTFKEFNRRTNRPYPYIVTSTITTDIELDNIRKSISKLKANYGLPTNMEIHASDLFHPRKNFPLSEAQIRDFASEFAEVIRSLNLRIISSVVFKDYILKKKRIGERLTVPHRLVKDDKDLSIDVMRIAYRHLFERVLKLADREYSNEWILIVHDQINVDKDYQMAKDQMNVVKIMEDELLNNAFITRTSAIGRIFKPILFANSANYDALQISDFAGYIIRKHVLNENSEKLFEIISNKLDKNPKTGKIEG